jgi:RNA polymerase sigma-70 factor (ECF subfamily)
MSSSPAFERELTELLPRLRRFAHALSRNGADADDLTQATVERALRSRDQWQPGTRLDSWLYRIMRNLWIDTVRSRGRRENREAPEEEALTVGDDPRDALEASLELKRAMAAMERLPGEQREVVALILIEGFGYREVSEMLDLPIGTVSSRLVRGRTALLAMLGGNADD